jgi:hypothetical protein
MFERGFAATSPAFDLYNLLVGQNIYENNLRRLPEIEKQRKHELIRTHIRPCAYNMLTRKSKHKAAVEKQF